MIAACEHLLFLATCSAAWNKSQKSLACSHRRPFRAKAYVIHTLLLCGWSVQQSVDKPQTQKEKNVDRMWAGVSLGERCVTSQKTAAEETNPYQGRNLFAKYFSSQWFACVRHGLCFWRCLRRNFELGTWGAFSRDWKSHQTRCGWKHCCKHARWPRPSRSSDNTLHHPSGNISGW